MEGKETDGKEKKWEEAERENMEEKRNGDEKR